jgi:aminomethyltransferase
MNRTPLYEAHLSLGAKMAPFGGWDMPIQYEGILAEHGWTRSKATIFDTCHMGEFELRGPTAEADLERLVTQSVAGIAVGRCRYGYLLRDDGGVLDDLTCYRRDKDHFWLIVNAGTCPADAGWIRRRLSPGTVFTDLSPMTGKLDIQGPESRAEMEKTLGIRLPDLEYFRFANVMLDGTACMLSRTGYTGERGYELYCPAGEVERFWTMFLDKSDIKPAGLGARDTLRLEVGYPLYGHELTADRTPIAASRGQFMEMKKDFIGKPGVARDLENGVPRFLVGLQLESRRAARAGDKVVSGGKAVGEITSGSIAPSLGVAVAMAYVDKALTLPGQRLEIDVHGAPLPATVVELPFYKQGTARGK